MYLRTDFLVRSTEEAIPRDQTLKALEAVSWVKGVKWTDSILSLSYDSGELSTLRLIEVIKNFGYEVVSVGKMTEVTEILDRV
ncbi:MAG TPA: hypothetical protein DD435_01380 [Cyanobacteria bacterium UBA8530]|nr:hypothetical protein [Cyanobacteria bacterium UBA8530]